VVIDLDSLLASQGTGKRIRHVKCRSLDAVARPALRKLLDDQGEIRRGSGARSG